MKNLFSLLLLFVLAISSCSKKDTCEDPVDCLPPITQTGEGTIGCLINGVPFTPGGHQLAGPTQQVFYQYVDGGYHFGLVAIDKRGDKYEGISLGTIKLAISEKTFIIKNDEVGNVYGRYITGGSTFNTTAEMAGELEITKFDENNGIVSGTFWFDAVNEEGEVVEIREGRFDMKL